jgi:hypothetical protein
MSPLITALFIVLCVGMIGAFAAFVRDRARYAGYRDMMRETIAFSKTIDGEIFRDAGDLVISGERERMPLVVRFSHAENTPGLSVRLGAPTTLSLRVVPRGQDIHEGRAVVKTADDVFNTRFDVRTDQPTEARLFVDSPKALMAIVRLCRSSHDFLSIGSAAIEFGQLGAPTAATVRALPGYVQALADLFRELRAMPGADLVKVEPRHRQRDYILRATIAAGVIAAAATLYVTAHEKPQRDQVTQDQNQPPEGISEIDAAAIPNVRQWHLATAADSGPAATSWLSDHDTPFSGHVALDMSGTGEKSDSAYFLVNDKGDRRVVVLMHGSKAYDARFMTLAAIARVPKDAMSRVQWSGSAPFDVQGDGLLVVRNPEQAGSAVVLFYNGRSTSSVVPANWQQVPVSNN